MALGMSSVSGFENWNFSTSYPVKVDLLPVAICKFVMDCDTADDSLRQPSNHMNSGMMLPDQASSALDMPA